MKLIVMLHLCPLEQFAAWSPEQRARYEVELGDNLHVLHQAGVRHLMVENNFDRELDATLGDRMPFFEHLLEIVCRRLDGTGITVGVCCRWADWRSTFRFVRQFGLAFCRLPLVGLRITTRSGKTMETTFGEIEAGLQACGSTSPIVLCDLIPKNCQITSLPEDLGQRVADLAACGATGLIIGERRSGGYLTEADHEHLSTAQQRWRLPAYVAGSVDDKRAAAMCSRGVGVIVGRFIYSDEPSTPHDTSPSPRLDAEKLGRLLTAVYGP